MGLRDKGKAKVSKAVLSEVDAAIKILRNGGVILYPTDTIWGLGCDATNEEAVKKIYDIKQRADNKSMIVLVNDIDMLYEYVQYIPDAATSILSVSVKPTTIIYPEARNLAKNIVAQDKSIGIRIVDEEFCNVLIKKYQLPIVSTSANISAEKSPGNFSQVSETIKAKVDYIVGLKQDVKSMAKASSIIKVESDNSIKIIR